LRQSKIVRVRGPLRPGCKVLRDTSGMGGTVHAVQRFFNPDGEPFDREMALNEWTQRLIADGDIEIVKPTVAAEAPKPARAPKDT
jgi:hypothetical protein